MAGKFGVYLRDNGVLSEERLSEALRAQAVYGGRLGTNLIDLGYLGLEELAAHLTDFIGAPLPPPAWLENPDPRAIKLVPLVLMRRYRLLPIRLDGARIHVAMLDPTNRQQLDYLAAASSRTPVPYTLPELRLLYWLEVHLGVDRHPRYVNLAARSRQTGDLDEALCGLGRILGADGAPVAARPESQFSSDQLGAPVEPAPRAAPEFWEDEEAEEEELLLDELILDEAPEPKPAVPKAATVPAQRPAEMRAPASSAEIAALEASMLGASERDTIVELALRITRLHSRAAAIFLVSAGTVSGFRGVGGGLSDNLEGIQMPLATHSVFARPAATTQPFRGPAPEGGIDSRLLSALGREDIHELLVLPVTIRRRVVNLLYCDNGADPFGETSVAALRALCSCIAMSYERLILASKGRPDRPN